MSTDNEELERLRAENQSLKDDRAATDLYGTVALGGAPGGGQPRGLRPTEDEEWLADFNRRLTSPTGQVTLDDIDHHAQLIGGVHMLVNLARVSGHFQRAGITPEVVAKYYRTDPMEQERARDPRRQKPGNVPKRRR